MLRCFTLLVLDRSPPFCLSTVAVVLQEARRKREEADFEAWKGLISMDDAGVAAQSQEQLLERRRALCDRLKAGKVRSLGYSGIDPTLLAQGLA